MKLLFTTICLLFAFHAFSQTSFEGTVRYVLHSPMEKEDLKLAVHFGQQGIKIETLEPNREKNNTYALIRFDSGKIYTINTEKKNYKFRKLSVKPQKSEVPPSKTILGYTTFGMFLPEISIPGEISKMLNDKTVFYVSDQLSYTIPEKFTNNAELMMVQQGKIVLGVDFYTTPYPFESDVDKDSALAAKNLFTVEAKEVIPIKFTDSDFLIPDGFTKRVSPVYFPDSTYAVDSAVAVYDTSVYYGDTTVSVYSEKPATKNKKKKPSKKKSTSVKQSAIQRKKD